MGSGLHYIKDYNDSSEALLEYTSNITLLAEVCVGSMIYVAKYRVSVYCIKEL